MLEGLDEGFLEREHLRRPDVLHVPPISSSIHGADILCEVAEKFDKGAMHGTVYADPIQKEKWTEEVDGTVGVEGYPAKIGTGTGEQVGGKHEPVALYCVDAKTPGAKGVLCIAGYPVSHPELEKDVVTALKGMKNSKAKK